MHRRDLLTAVGLLTGTAVAAPIAAALFRETPNPGTLQISRAQSALIGALAEIIIPETDTPGALAAGVAPFITRIVSQYLDQHEAHAYLAGISEFGQLAEKTYGRPWKQITTADQLALANQIDELAFSHDDSTLAEFWRRHKALTVAGYYTSEVGASIELRRMPMGPYKADIPYDQIGRSWS